MPRIPSPRQAADDLDPLPGIAAGDAGAGPDTGPPEATAAAELPPEPESAARPGTGQEPPPAPAASAPDRSGPASQAPPHTLLTSLLGAWALSACSAEETEHVESHLTECAPCAEEALRLRDAVELLQADRSLDLDPQLRSRVMENCLGRRAPRIPVPDWAHPYDAETARLDALLRDFGDAEWHAPVRLKWYENEQMVGRRTTVAKVIGHLMSVDGLVAAALGLRDPLGPGSPLCPTERTEKFWDSATHPPTRALHAPWRELSHNLIRTASFAGPGAAELSVSYGDFALPLRDALLDRAFECWVHGGDIAEAVDYPYAEPSAGHLHRMIDLAARLLPGALAGRRRSGLAAPARDLVSAGSAGRSLHLEVEGAGGGDWFIPLDSPAAIGSRELAVAQVALDGVEFCRLVAGHVCPEEAAAGQDGDREAIRDVLSAAAALSRL